MAYGLRNLAESTLLRPVDPAKEFPVLELEWTLVLSVFVFERSSQSRVSH